MQAKFKKHVAASGDNEIDVIETWKKMGILRRSDKRCFI